MITNVISGDLIHLALKCKFDAIVHGANCFTTMNHGIALTIKKIFPQAYEADLRTKYGDKNKLGTISVAKIKLTECYFDVINAYTQHHYKRTPQKPINVDYQAIESAFKIINDKYKGKHIGIPKIGAGLAEGDWDKIESIINKVTPDINITLVNYEK